MLRLGLCCVFSEAPIRFRTTTVRYLETFKDKGANPEEFLSQIVLFNVMNLAFAVEFCKQHHIGSFRINSGFLPIYTHPEWGYHLENLPDAEKIFEGLKAIKKLAFESKVRLTFHPDQFVVLSSPNKEVVKNSLKELEYQAYLSDLVGADVMNVHGGGSYGNKEEALKRFILHFDELSSRAKKILTVENDDRVYTPEDLFPLCQALKIPLVYDAHHHRCLKDRLSIEEATQKALATWNREPLFHISSPKDGWGAKDTKKHHDFIQLEDIPVLWREIEALTVDIEAKAKEVAIEKLYHELKEKGWALT